jgi:transposase-like protein
MALQAKLSKIEFQQKFSTEEACEKQLFQMKWPNGYRCEKCACESHSTITTRNLPLYQCKKCGYQATVIVNTILEKTRTSLVKWFIAIYGMATDKRGYSATQLARDIEVSYPTAWLMLHKIREAMGNRDEKYRLAGIVEMDESYFGGPDKGGKRGRGTEKVKVLAGLSLEEGGRPRFAKMEVINDVKGKTILDFARHNVEPGSRINSDAYRSYNALTAEYQHTAKDYNPIDDPDHLKWLHVILSNAKAFIQGTFHGLDKIHLQRYLNEFCYRFNRRRFEGQGFFRLLNACVISKTITYNELTL